MSKYLHAATGTEFFKIKAKCTSPQALLILNKQNRTQNNYGASSASSFSQRFDYGQNGLHFNSLLESHSCLKKNMQEKKFQASFVLILIIMALQLMKIRNPPSQTTTIFQFQFEQIMVQIVQIRCISWSRSVHATTITGKSADWQPSMTRANHRRPVLKRLAGRCCVKAYQWKPGWGKKNMTWWESIHKQGWPQLWEDCQDNSIPEGGRPSQGVDWGWCQCIRSSFDISSKLRSKFFTLNFFCFISKSSS